MEPRNRRSSQDWSNHTAEGNLSVIAAGTCAFRRKPSVVDRRNLTIEPMSPFCGAVRLRARTASHFDAMRGSGRMFHNIPLCVTGN